MNPVPANSFHPKTRAEWRSWLEENHPRSEGVWLIGYRRVSGKERVEYEEAVEEALCFGWIDAVTKKLDEERTALWFAPRKPRSGWSRSNKERVERLLQNGLMASAGLAKIEAAKKDGSWTLLDSAEALEIPPDLAAALARDETARRCFEAFPNSEKKGILGWIAAARRPETREKRIDQTVRLAVENTRVSRWREKKP